MTSSGCVSRTLRASGLPKDVDESELRAAFGHADWLLDVRLARDADGACCGYALLDFDSEQHAFDALETQTGQPIPGHRVPLQLTFVAAGSGGVPLKSYQLCVGNLAETVTDAALYDAVLAVAPDAAGVRVITNRTTRQAQGFGFVRFNTSEAAYKAMPHLQGIPVDGRPLVVREARHERESASEMRAFHPTSVIVQNLGKRVTEYWLTAAFRPFGDIKGVRLAQRAGFGIVTFLEPAATLAAVSLMHEREFEGGRLSVDWSYDAASIIQREQHIAQGRHLAMSARRDRMLPAAAKHRAQDKGRGKSSAKGQSRLAPGHRASAGPSQQKVRARLPDSDESNYSFEWHASMQPVLTPARPLEVPQGAPLDAADKMYWLSFFLDQGAASNTKMNTSGKPLDDEPLSKRARNGV